MDQKARRAIITKVLKAAGAKPRKGHLRLQAGDLFWYVDVRADSPAPGASLTFEVGAWLPAAGPEPEGGAVDCPLLADVPVGTDARAATDALVEVVAPVGSTQALRRLIDDEALPGALVDRRLRSVLDG